MKRTLFIALCFIAFLLCVGVTNQSYAQAYRWKSLSMGGAGFVSGIITSKQEQNLMYARTDVGGAYKWNAASSTWTQLLDFANATQSGFYGVESMAIDPQATNKLYLYVGINYFDNGKSAILRSNDYGQTFTTIDVTNQFKAHGNGAGRSNGERLQVDPNLGSVLYVGTRVNGLWKSVDYGSTWTQLTGLNLTTTPNANGISFVLIDPASGTPGVASQTVYIGVSRYASVGDNFYKSTDGGLTFTPITGGPAAYMPQRAVLTNNGDLVMNYANGAGPSGNTSITPTEPMDNGGIYKYNIASGTWTALTPSGISRAWGGLTVDPANPQRMMASTINNYQLQYGPANGGAYGDRIYLSINGGTTWRDVVNPGFTLNTNGIPWIYGQAIHWAGSMEFDPFNTSKVYITSGNGLFSNDNIDVVGNPWKFDVKGLEETVPTAVVSLPGGPLLTTIGDYDGFTYTNLNAYGTRLTPAMGTTTGLAYASNNPNFLVRVGSKIYYSTDQGANWVSTAVINGSQGKIAVTANGGAMIHCPNGSSNIYYSSNNGASWIVATNTAGGGAFSLSNALPVADMVNPNKVYLYNNGSGNFSMSTTGGASFTVMVNIGTGGNKLFRTIPGQEGDIWVPMYGGGLKRSTNSGTSFTTIAGVSACSAIGYGKAAPSATYPTLYIWGTVGGVTGIFKSIDQGANWTRLNDDAHQFGGPGNAQAIMGDMNNYGVVYMTTVGRGVVIGYDPAITPLPVSLVSFSVKGLEQGDKRTAMLTWKTAQEFNLDYFSVERSTDAQTWARITTVSSKAPNGISNSIMSYDCTDDVSGSKGLIYYRLKLMDKDGRFTYSSIGILSPIKSSADFSITVLPNPVAKKQMPFVRIVSALARPIMLSVSTANGVLLQQKLISLPGGSTNINLPEAANLPAGIYLLTVKTADGKSALASTKLLIQ